MFVKICGVHGVGKTTISEMMIKNLTKRGFDADRVHGADIMARILGISVDELRVLSDDQKVQARELMFREIYKNDHLYPDRIILRDAHFSLRDVKGKKIRSIPLVDEDREHLKAIVVLTAPKDEILKRRQADIRVDRSLNIEEINEEIQEETKIAREQAQKFGIPLFEVKNFGVLPDRVADKIVDLLVENSVLPERNGRKIEIFN
jgi:adenylate kinase